MAGAHSGEPLTVGAALTHPALREARLVAGAGGLGRHVEGVTVLDVLDLDGLGAGQLVLSSAYPLAGVSLRRLVERLDAAGSSALGLKTRGFWAEPPAQLVETADALGLPLLVLPEGRFADLITPLLEEIAERQAERLRRTAELHRALMEASLRQEGLPAVVKLLGDALGVSVAVVGEDGQVLATNAPGEAWERASRTDERCFVAPITVGERRYGSLVALDPPADDAFVRAAMSLSSVVSGIELLRERQVAAVHRKYQRELLDDLAEGRVSETEARERARRIGWPLHRPYVVLAAVRRHAGALGEDDLLALSRAVLAGRPDARPFWRAPGLGMVVHLAPDEDARAVVALLRGRLPGTRRLDWVPDELVLGVSRPTTEVADFVAAFREASLAALLTSPLERDAGGIAHFDDLGAARVLALAEDRGALVRAARAVLGELADGSHASRELLETLAVLLANNLRLTRAAGELFFHYNTVRHRFARLRALLGERLATPEGRLLLWLAVTTLRIADSDERLFGGSRPSTVPQ